MLNNGFEHRQYSGYISIETMSYRDITMLLYLIKNELPWLEDCAQRIDATIVIDEEINILGVLKNIKIEK